MTLNERIQNAIDALEGDGAETELLSKLLRDCASAIASGRAVVVENRAAEVVAGLCAKCGGNEQHFSWCDFANYSSSVNPAVQSWQRTSPPPAADHTALPDVESANGAVREAARVVADSMSVSDDRERCQVVVGYARGYEAGWRDALRGGKQP